MFHHRLPYFYRAINLHNLLFSDRCIGYKPTIMSWHQPNPSIGRSPDSTLPRPWIRPHRVLATPPPPRTARSRHMQTVSGARPRPRLPHVRSSEESSLGSDFRVCGLQSEFSTVTILYLSNHCPGQISKLL